MCKICIASIIATLEWMPVYTQTRSSKPSPPETPIFFNSSTVSTPESETSHLTAPQRVNSTLRTDLRLKIKKKKRAEFGYAIMTMMKCVLVLSLIPIGRFTFTIVTSRIIETKLCDQEIARNLSDKSLGFQDVGFLINKHKNIVGDPNWKTVRECKRRFVFEQARSFSSTMELLKFQMMRAFRWVRQLWRSSDGNHLVPT
ncbi:hypothetical protein L1987_32090 [Smallanthus sonchifolius]|uniref:Uncharacterized protein n=1 Tax=Smallanthus sonchifolius TaxID=185202 RepID=A0ACB9I7E1_9ASTR|nr:hypothetical protein L1987_32090 [Smallanthus sonchifolius]